MCSDQKPGSAPTLLNIVAGVNSVTLYWSLASNPVTYYLVTYGLTPGAQTYGNPNVGDRNTTSYTVNQLSGGTTYYFRIRAGNGCMPGDFSNELSSTPMGGFVVGVPAGFAEGVLGVSTPSAELSPTVATPENGQNGEVKGAKTSFNKNLIWLVVVLGAFIGFIYLRKRSKKS